jgi:hypothetical protein
MNAADLDYLREKYCTGSGASHAKIRGMGNSFGFLRASAESQFAFPVMFFLCVYRACSPPSVRDGFFDFLDLGFPT